MPVSRCVGLVLVACLAGRAHGQSAVVDTATMRRVVETVARTMSERYVVSDTGRMVADHLRDRLRQGVYARPLDIGRFMDRLTADMQAINGDRHLYMLSGNTAGRGGQPVRRSPGDGGNDPQLVADRRANHNVDAAQRLSGNVGYLAVSELSGRTEEAYRTLDMGLAFLARTDAMIIDLRTTRGGTVPMSDYLAGYFLGPDVRTLNTSVRASNQTWERVTPKVMGAMRADVPVVLLIGPGTASGGEDFAFLMRRLKRAVLVGERTAGAGRPTSYYPAGDGFTVSVSGGRTWDPQTGAEWERKGIEPDIPATQDEGIGIAHMKALDLLAAATADSTYRKTLEWTRNAVRARTTPVKVSEQTLRGYAGTYDQRLVKFERGRLFYLRDSTRPPQPLLPVTETSFVLGDGIAVDFIRDGDRIVAMRVTPPAGAPSTFPRTP